MKEKTKILVIFISHCLFYFLSFISFFKMFEMLKSKENILIIFIICIALFALGLIFRKSHLNNEQNIELKKYYLNFEKYVFLILLVFSFIILIYIIVFSICELQIAEIFSNFSFVFFPFILFVLKEMNSKKIKSLNNSQWVVFYFVL